ncbi:translocation/assembly module TamB domain-containing protein [Tropicimonas isoalkanivorans]|uniref:Autotransporter secretion inner membrane protein TamB n=1 Tax=Tropicimonas isoalkanivorans TaxID=441112 RepID=A0A1I1PH24_9RHOB|nr:translocation/assembly module TamB domain-containing protein [Tropicimonas isoalkanivorans]SFD09111.1 autotransporter secretion inner membrane protein TamB [Tropicimonas isoalkanivorans]
MTRLSLATTSALALSLALPAQAQEDGGGMIQRFLQDKLSTAGREVSISGFQGLLSGEATLNELTIADEEGVWLILRDARLDWSRTALLRGNLRVEELSAGELIVVRKPVPGPDTAVPDAPDAEASGFSLPELPVAIKIDKVAIERAELGEPVLGQEAVLSLDGSVQLADGEGTVDIQTERLDRQGDRISLAGSFENESRELTLNLELHEQAGGLAANLLNLPGAPSVDLTVNGAGQLSDFDADIALRTDDQDRVAGTVRATAADAGGTNFSADIGGDVTPLLPAEYHEFFGTDIRLLARGNRAEDGAIDLSELTVSAQSLDLQGNAQIGADGLPRAFDLTGEMGAADGGPLRLPVAGAGTFVTSMTLDAAFDAAQSDRWTLDAVVDGLETETGRLEQVSLNGVGTIKTNPQAVTADVLFDASGIALADPGLDQAVGDALSGGASLSWDADGPLNITRLYVDGEDYGASVLGDARIAGRSLQLSGEGRVHADDLSRFSTISGQQLTGQASADVTGQGDVLGGQFAVSLDLAGDGLSIGQETVDRLLTEPVTLSTSVRRDTTGTTLDSFNLSSRAITATASGKVGSGESDIGFEAALSDIGLVMPGQEGAVEVKGSAKESAPDDWQVDVTLDGPWDLTGDVSGRVKPGESDLTLDVSLPDIAPLAPGYTGAVNIQGQAAETGTEGNWNLDLDVAAPYDLTAQIEGLYAPGATDVDLNLSLPDISPLAPGLEGAVDLAGNAAETDAGGWQFNLNGTGPYQAALDLAGTITPDQPDKITFSAGLPDISPLVPTLSGPVRAEGTATDAGSGLWQVDFDAAGPLDAQATVNGVVGNGQSDLELDVSIPDLSPLVPQVSGPISAKGTAQEAGDGRWNVDFDVDGPQGATAALTGAVGGTGTDVDVTVDVPNVSAFAPGITGPLRAQASAAQTDAGGWNFDVDASGPYSSTVTAGGTYGGGATDLTFQAAMPNVSSLAPGLSGPLSLNGTAREAEAGAWTVAVDANAPYNATANVTGTVGGAGTALDLSVRIPSVSPFAPGVTGSMNATGTVRQQGDGYGIELSTNGPEGVSSNVSGTVAGDFATMNLSATGSAPLAAANRFISPAAVAGTAQFDLAVNGEPSLQSLSGTVSTSGARLVIPGVLGSLEGIGVRLDLRGETMQIDATANAPEGGSVGVNGTVQLTGAFNGDLRATLNELVLFDPLLFRTSLNGGLNITGPLTGGATIAGRVNVGRTEIRVPDGGLGFGGAIPDVTHVNEPSYVFVTRQRAGLIEANSDGNGSSGGGGGPVYNLDVRVSVPDRLFIRGRGLDVEMGGNMLITGTTAAPNPVGQVEVIRGRLEILGQRLDVGRGTISLAGGLTPYIDINAFSQREDFQFTARIFGPVNDPDFNLNSTPSLPEDEVLAQFLFGKGIAELSPLQAVQLANALATLTGRGGVGVLGNLRSGLGLDDLDLTTNAAGATEVRAGRYLSENVYTEFVADSDGETGIDINIDVSRNFTVRGSAASDGDSSIGVYWERDY